MNDTNDEFAVPTDLATDISRSIGTRSVVLVGMMGAGKSSVGRRLAQALKMPFVDADHEIEVAAGRSIPEIFAEFGEAHFREGESRVIARLLGNGPQVLATGGGAMMNEDTRKLIAEHGVSVWLRADIEVLMKRVRRRSNRPLLKAEDPEAVMRKLLEVRDPFYATADITVESRNVPHGVVVSEIAEKIDAYLNRNVTSGENV
ncbi:shikimate kinase [Tepidamorphus sp. 3E244]|uniref:shikimate kinase n=1 Tax=Tepidamorphus sp. 3E244 TaxID=3385498 RepID=UPI0038FCD4F7